MGDWRSLGMLLHLGWTFALAVLIPLAIGLWIDHRLSTSPLFIFVGALLGILIATVGVVRVTTRAIDGLGKPAQQQAGEANRKEDEQ